MTDITHFIMEYNRLKREFIALSKAMNEQYCPFHHDCINCPFAPNQGDCVIGAIEEEFKDVSPQC